MSRPKISTAMGPMVRPLVLVPLLLPFRAQLRRRLPYGSLKVLQPPPRKAAGPPARITAAMAALVMALQTATVKGSRAAPDSAGDSNIMAQLLMMMLVFIIIGVFVAGMKLGATMERIRSHDTRVKDVPPQLTVTQNAPIQADPAGRSRRSSRGTDRAIDRAIYVTKGGDRYHLDPTCNGLRSRKYPLGKREPCQLCVQGQ